METQPRDQRINLLSQMIIIQEQLEDLETQLQDAEDLLALADSITLDLEQKCARLQNDNERKDQQIQRLKEALLRKGESDCQNCSDKDSPECPGEDLCGKRILYVGGMHKMVQHYRKIIEERGGEFMHHDGGKEIAKSRLPGMIYQADAVVCPIDCVSHDACLSVKKYCKQSQKPYLMMRGSGLSSLTRELEKFSELKLH
ncbi:DUF2325 domain-containing protein [Desulfosediminicola flagellatus]|uniref:DUF2325 domain-containing protein n=1 Tax=Desulfosediminicola flagellatus TaxID=2569541 RepID=UPI00142EF9AC|nr:DUF2325 domain-containing protein [Desulfosediminicola flagellatus]